MTGDEWHRLEALFEELETAPAATRDRVLQDLASSEPGLASALRGMLAADAPEARLRGLVDGAAHALATAATSPPPRFGPYAVVREIGRGGMGVVYEAVSDDEFRRRVAIKVAPLARLGAAASARFRQERQILASLEHPCIARFLDAGTEGDLPYLVMEYVDGEPITLFANQRRLTTRERLRLIRQLADALQYAHQRLVVHRDLKPSNVLVTADGMPKLLDFGVAKLMDADGTHAPTLGFGGWTPDYASPELALGHVVGTPADLYGLGLVTYETLTGRPAQRVEATTPLAAAQAIVDSTPPVPSTRAADAGEASLARQLRGDIDTIVMTCLQKDPARRYPSAGALAEDIDRHLRGRPIVARPATWGYRASKWLGRNRVAAAALAVAATASATGVASSVYQARRAEHRFQQVRALANEFVFTVHDRIETLPGATDARRAIVQTALTYLGNLQEGAADDADLARELAAAYERVGTVQGHPLAANLGEPDAAVQSYERAIALLEPLEAAGDAEAALQLASVTYRLGHIRRAQGDLAATSRAFQRALALGERLRLLLPDRAEVLSLLGELNADIARAAMERRDLDTARPAAERSMRAAEDLVRMRPDDQALQNGLATSLNALGAVALASAEIEAAEEAYERAAAIRERLVESQPGHLEYQRALAVTYGNLGDVRYLRPGQNMGDAAGAADALSRAVTLSQAMASADANDRRAQFDLVNAALRLGSVLSDIEGRQAEALALLEQAHGINARLREGEPASERYAFLQVVLDRRLGRALRQIGRTREAVAPLERARTDGGRMLAGPNGANARTQIALATSELASIRLQQGESSGLDLTRESSRLLDDGAVPPLAAAEARGELAASLVAAAGRMRGRIRVDALALASPLVEQASEQWRTAPLPASLHPRREAALARLASIRDMVATLSPE